MDSPATVEPAPAGPPAVPEWYVGPTPESIAAARAQAAAAGLLRPLTEEGVQRIFEACRRLRELPGFEEFEAAIAEYRRQKDAEDQAAWEAEEAAEAAKAESGG